jgi:hypothetical protein
MKTIREPERDVPVVHQADLCVIGGSCTGVFAAVRAARLGADVAIVEKHNCFGGVATAGGVHVWHSLHDTEGDQPIIGGLTQEIIRRLERRGAVQATGRASSAFLLNTEELKIELDELVVESCITPFLHTLYVAPVTEDGRIAAVLIENKNGRQAIRASQFVDATGDADLALSLGLQSFAPDAFQPPTTCARLYGLHTLGDFDWVAAVREHGQEFGLAPDWGWGAPVPGLPGIQMRADTHVFGADTSDADQLTRAEIEGRRQVRAIMDVIRKYGPSGASVALADLAATMGARETRRIVARYRLTGDDVLNGRQFPDAIANGSYRVDIHHANDSGITFRYLDGTEEVIPERGRPARLGRWREPLPEEPTYYQIPLRCLVQTQVPNLMLAGRMLDADKVAFSAVRVMVNMNQTGEAAGVASALALRNGRPVQHLDPALVRTSLSAGGSIML